MKRVALTALLCLAFASGAERHAYAQAAPAGPSAPQMQEPAALPPRGANFSWDHALLRANFSASDIVTKVVDSNGKTVAENLRSGLRNDIVTRAYVFEEGRTEPVALAARSCTVAYDLWDDFYQVKVLDPGAPGGERKSVVANVEGVIRKCIDAQDFAIVDRGILKKGKAHFLGVIVEVNPISDDMLKQIRQQVSRPTGATGLTTGDALFGSFVSLFVRQIGKADATLVFRTQQTFVP
jgi:hypothetical protein